MASMNFTSGANRTAAADSGPASDHHPPTTTAAAQNYLARRCGGVEAVETPYETRFDRGPPEGRSAIQDFLAGLLLQLPPQGQHERPGEGAPSGTMVDSCYVKLIKVFDTTYSSERSFNGALFRAMGECILQAAAAPPAGDDDDVSSRHRRSWLGRQLGGQPRTALPPTPTPRRRVLVTEQRIVLDRIVNPSADGYEFAVGLAREVAFNLEPGSCLLRCKAQLDHALVLLVRRAGGTDRDWVVWRALAAVDLKRGGMCVRSPDRGVMAALETSTFPRNREFSTRCVLMVTVRSPR
jgi:hypothetical protein